MRRWSGGEAVGPRYAPPEGLLASSLHKENSSEEVAGPHRMPGKREDLQGDWKVAGRAAVGAPLAISRMSCVR